MSDRVSKELSASAKILSESREVFIEVYIDNLIVIIYPYKIVGCEVLIIDAKPHYPGLFMLSGTFIFKSFLLNT